MIDGLVELLTQLVHKTSVRAEKKVEREINSEFRRVHGKTGILVKLAATALTMPEEIVRKSLHPVVGKQTLQDCGRRAPGRDPGADHVARLVFPSLPARPAKLLAAVSFRCNNTSFRPVMDALALLERYRDSEDAFYAGGRDRAAGVCGARGLAGGRP